MITFPAFMRRPESGAVLSLVAVVAFFVVFGGVNLMTLAGAASWVNFAANLGIVAIPVGLLMIAGEMDISIGAMVPAGSITTALLSALLVAVAMNESFRKFAVKYAPRKNARA